MAKAKSNRKYLPAINIENATIFWKNFAGEENENNAAGNRNFCVFLEPDVAQQLSADGWNVKSRVFTSDDEPEEKFYIQVKVSYRKYVPKIVLVKESGMEEIIESNVGTLDRLRATNIDLIISPSFWERNGRSGVAAYLDTMYFKAVETDPFAAKYAQYRNHPGIEDTSDSTPFEI